MILLSRQWFLLVVCNTNLSGSQLQFSVIWLAVPDIGEGKGFEIVDLKKKTFAFDFDSKFNK